LHWQAAAAEEEARLEYEASIEGMRRAERERRAAAEEEDEETENTGSSGSGGGDPSAPIFDSVPSRDNLAERSQD